MQLSVKDQKLYKKKLSKEQKKEYKEREDELKELGITIGDIKTDRHQNRFFLCFIRTILIFLATYGMTGGIVSSFNLSFSVPIVVVSLFVLAFFSAFLYYNKLSFYIGYLVVFAGFLVFSVAGYWYVNSGYQAFMNELYNQYSDFFGLLSQREATEFITNRYLTVTCAMIFMGWFFSILLNITISGYMNLPLTFLITFLPLQTVFYIDKVPDMPYLIMLIAVYVSVAVLGKAGHFGLPYRHEKGEEFDRMRKKKGKGLNKKTVLEKHVYLASSSGMLSVAVYSILISAVFLILTAGIFSASLKSKYVSNKLKDTTDKYVKAAVQGGLTSLLDRYPAVGGMGNGKLGGIGNVTPDFQTDLTVRFVPFTSGNVYLKGYEGAYYTKNNFSPLPESVDKMSDPAYIDEGVYQKMWIGNLDASSLFDYKPYNTYYSGSRKGESARGISNKSQKEAKEKYKSSFKMLDPDAPDEALKTGSGYLETYEELFLPYDMKINFPVNPAVTEEYEDYVYENYLNVPEDLEPVLDDFLEEASVSFDMSKYGRDAYDANDPESRKKALQYKMAAVSDLGRYFMNNFPYTMTPGATPRGEDAVAYFLTEQRRGFCAHFASSSALLLRRLGIPTRYVEGYMISFSQVQDANGYTTDTRSWYQGDGLYDNAAVVEIDVTDASAHGWIEIWIDGYGWIPYEMTPPSDEDETAGGGLYDLFAGLFFRTARDAAGAPGDDGTDMTDGDTKSKLTNMFKSFDFLAGPFAWTVLIFVSLAAAYYLVRSFRYLIALKKALNKKRYSEALLIRYRKKLQDLKRKGIVSVKYPTLREAKDIMRENADASKGAAPEETDRLFDVLGNAAYSGNDIGRGGYDEARGIMSRLRFIKKKH